MCLSKVHDVDVVTQTCSVLGRVVVSEDAEALTLADGCLGDERDEVVRTASWEFAEEG